VESPVRVTTGLSVSELSEFTETLPFQFESPRFQIHGPAFVAPVCVNVTLLTFVNPEPAAVSVG
jgi:hypothetical protein